MFLGLFKPTDHVLRKGVYCLNHAATYLFISGLDTTIFVCVIVIKRLKPFESVSELASDCVDSGTSV